MDRNDAPPVHAPKLFTYSTPKYEKKVRSGFKGRKTFRMRTSKYMQANNDSSPPKYSDRQP